MKKSDARKCKDAMVYRVAELLFEQRDDGQGRRGMKEIAELVNKESRGGRRLTRESIYPLIEEAVGRKFVRLVPPVNKALGMKLIEKYPSSLSKESVRVVETAGPADNAKVAVAAAELALEYTMEIAKAREGKAGAGRVVGVGLGPGRATLDFCKAYVELLKSCDEPAMLRLVAITAGCPANSPEYASTSFFNLFPERMVSSRTGLFAETLVPLKAYEEIKKRPGVKEAFEARESIDVVVTSMGDANDEDDLLSVFLRQSGEDLKRLRDKGWAGNVQYRPYSLKGPIKEKASDLRAVTLFELEDLVRISGQKQKHVILIARQCGHCKRTRAEAVRPLLTNPDLKVFSTLVLDAATAVELLKG